MRDIIEHISTLPDFANVLFICDPATDFTNSFGKFLHNRVNVVGPASSGEIALLIAAQTPLDLVVVGPRFAQAEDAPDLMVRLERDWGVPCLIARREAEPAWDA
jgi:hypothetical protein